MSAGRLALPAAGREAARRRRRSGCGSRAAASSCSPRPGAKKRAGVWLLTPGGGRGGARAPRARRRSGSGGAARGDPRAPTRGGCTRCSATSAAIAGIGRAWANEILHTRAALAVRALRRISRDEEVERLSAAIDEELAARPRAARARREGREGVYRVHNHLGEPCPDCGTPIARVDYEEHTIYYCPQCQTGGRVLKDRRLSRLLR